MKCKSWSNKINNFVVGRLKSIKINGQQQQQTTATTTIQPQQQQQQQYLSTCSTMPAMPKEKATAVSLSESNFSELNLKELATSAAVVAAIATTATATVTTMAATSRLQQQVANNATAAATTSQQQQQQHQQKRNSLCGCGAASAINADATSNDVAGSINLSKYYVNGHSSPLAAAVASQQPQQRQNTTYTTSTASSSNNTSPQRINNSSGSICCRTNNRTIQQQQQQQNGSCSNATNTTIMNNNNINNNNNTTAYNDASSTLAVNNKTAAPVVNCAAITPPKKSPRDFIFGKFIGEGSFSYVYLAVDVHTKREYAIKVCDKRQILREHKQEYIRREREVMHEMTNTPGFVNLSCTFQDNRSLYFVMTYAKNGDLLPYINKVGSFDVDCTRHYAAELVLACEQMRRHNVVHRDLKPENILLDEDMHTLIADFGSAKMLTAEETYAGSAQGVRQSRSHLPRYDYDDDDENDDDDTSDDVDSPSRQGSRYHRRRKGSFVGTAQYVSPEVLQNGPITTSADLWALGCIIYQMISGLPPFRGSNDYVIFREILACNLDFPQGFDKEAEDLVRKLLKVNPKQRLGAQDENDYYESIRSHPFFANIDFDTVRQQVPPPIYPYLPGVTKDEDFRSQYRDLEPGLDDKQLTRLFGMDLGTALDTTALGCEQNGSSNDAINGDGIGVDVEIEKKTVTKNIFDLTDAEKQRRLELQKSDKWHVFADNEVILKNGFVNKRKGLFARKRMLLLTTGPRLIYIDPVQMVKKGEIPWSSELRVEPKNFKIFFVHTPNRTYYLEDPEGYSLEWVDAIQKMRVLTYGEQQTSDATTTITTTTTSFCQTTNTIAYAMSTPRTALSGSSGTAITTNYVTTALKTASN